MSLQQGGGQRPALFIAVALIAITILYFTRGRIIDAAGKANSEACLPVIEEKPNCLVELTSGRWELATDGCVDLFPRHRTSFNFLNSTLMFILLAGAR